MLYKVIYDQICGVTGTWSCHIEYNSCQNRKYKIQDNTGLNLISPMPPLLYYTKLSIAVTHEIIISCGSNTEYLHIGHNTDI